MGFKFFRCYLRCEMKQNEKQCFYSKRAKPFAGKGRIYIAPISDIKVLYKRKTRCFNKTNFILHESIKDIFLHLLKWI